MKSVGGTGKVVLTGRRLRFEEGVPGALVTGQMTTAVRVWGRQWAGGRLVRSRARAFEFTGWSMCETGLSGWPGLRTLRAPGRNVVPKGTLCGAEGDGAGATS